MNAQVAHLNRLAAIQDPSLQAKEIAIGMRRLDLLEGRHHLGGVLWVESIEYGAATLLMTTTEELEEDGEGHLYCLDNFF